MPSGPTRPAIDHQAGNPGTADGHPPQRPYRVERSLFAIGGALTCSRRLGRFAASVLRGSVVGHKARTRTKSRLLRTASLSPRGTG